MKSFADVLMEKGERKGKREGEKQKALAIAKRMKARGDSIDEIIEMTDLTVDDVLKL
jgi:predicted transposase/invertase (TIGR01784 family)